MIGDGAKEWTGVGFLKLLNTMLQCLVKILDLVGIVSSSTVHSFIFNSQLTSFPCFEEITTYNQNGESSKLFF